VTVLLLLLAAAVPVRASMSIYMEPEDLARRASVVVEAIVLDSASGFDPVDGSLSTYVTLAVERFHRGALEESTLVLREPGGSFAGLVHHVDAVPRYVPGERVLAFLEAAPDGALRTAGMFFGKYSIDTSGPRGVATAHRSLDGQGLIAGRPVVREESLPLADLVAVAAGVPRSHRPRPALTGPPNHRRAPTRPLAAPPELSRLQWESGANRAGPPGSSVDSGTPNALAEQPASPAPTGRFAPLSDDYPSRWYESDAGAAITVHVDRVGNPLGDGALAAAQVARALAAWTGVPESRLVLLPGEDDYDYRGTFSTSPAAHYSGVNVVLFDDPYHDISDPVGCSGVLAIGGYWRSTDTAPRVNGVTFHRAMQLYVIFNNGFECFLGNAENLAEVATHELGHGIGLGHSDAPDSIMRSFAYGYRGPRLGDDDRDAAHCHYPHELVLLSPVGGEVWEAGSVQAIEWSSSEEAGADNGEVDVQYSVDGGATWRTIATHADNDGHQLWLLPDEPATGVRVRVVRGQRAGFVPAIFPAVCSGDASAGALSIVEPIPVAGAIPVNGGGLTLQAQPSGSLRLRWDASCSPDVTTHAVYEGSLDALRAGRFNPARVTCEAGPDLVEYVDPAAGDRYYLVAPLAAGREGSLGTDSTGAARPQAPAACAPREEDSSCR
jgi:hypothetical protein